MKSHKPLSTSFKQLQVEWYARLESEEFPEIEDTTHSERPLKEWHSRKFKSDQAKIRAMDRERYETQLSDFINSGDIDEICALIVRHGNCKLTPDQVKMVIEFHREGLSERKIAVRINQGRDVIYFTLKRAKAWMRLVV